MQISRPGSDSSKAFMVPVLRIIKALLVHVVKIMVHIGTLPYYRFFQFNTIKPILRIAAYTSNPDKFENLLRLMVVWRTRKLAELHFISIACAILAAAVIGSFSWNTVPDAYWLASALWHSSLVLSILGILLSAQQVAVLDLLGPLTTEKSLRSSKVDVRRYLPLMLSEMRQQEVEAESHLGRSDIGSWKPRWKMVFTWQCPMMFMSYSVCFFLAGLTIFICTPLIQGGEWNTDSNIAVVYLAVAATAGCVFMFCTFWVYHYVDLEYDVRELDEDFDRGTMLDELPQSSRGPERVKPISQSIRSST